MKPECHNTRLSITPSGPVHIGHLWNALLNRAIAIGTGGQFEPRWETWMKWTLDEELFARATAQSNLSDLEAFGGGPTHGMDPVSREDRLKEIWGLWQAIDGPRRWGTLGRAGGGTVYAMLECEGLSEDQWPVHSPTMGPASLRGCLIGTCIPVWTTFARVAEDMLTKRTLILRGADLREDTFAYMMFAHELRGIAPHWEPPTLMYHQMICCDYPEDGWPAKLTSGFVGFMEGFWLKDLLAMEIDPDWLAGELWIRCAPPWAKLPVTFLKGMTQNQAVQVLSNAEQVVINRDEWRKTLEDAPRRTPCTSV